jgi:hypothetical protein
VNPGNRCREEAGMLFKKKCHELATHACSQCKKPVCGTHCRAYWQTVVCVTCLRQLIKQQPQQRASYAHLHDDPYFYWYFYDDAWMGGPYDADDYALFDDHQGPDDFGADSPGGWQGT